MNEGARKLSRSGTTQEQIASRANVTRQAVIQWIRGATRPSPTARKRLKKAYGIEPILWDQDCKNGAKVREPGTPAAAKTAPALPPKPLEIESAIDEVEHSVARQLAQLRNDPNTTPLELSRVTKQLSSTLHDLAAARERVQKSLLQTAVWRKLRGALTHALIPFPEALEAVEREIQRITDEIGD